LLGVPVAIKDNVDYAGEVTTDGTAAYGEPATEDGHVVRRLREAGATILGKTNLPELAIYGFTESPTWGDTRNPWDTSRTFGGSSGGSGAATAAGMCSIATRPTERARFAIRPPTTPLRPQAAAEPRLALAGSRALVRPLGIGLREPNRDGHSALPST